MASSRPKVYSALVTPAIAFLCLATVVPIAAVIALSFGDFNIAFPEKTRLSGFTITRGSCPTVGLSTPRWLRSFWSSSPSSSNYCVD